jgi:carboxypeptidase family protein
VERVSVGRCCISAAIVISSIVVEANECIVPKPAKISGALCGRVFDATGGVVPNVQLRVVDDSGNVVADVQADSKADFVFTNIAKGKYRLKATSAGWLIEFGEFEITRPKATCTNPVTVRLDIACCCFGSGIVNKRPRGY